MKSFFFIDSYTEQSCENRVRVSSAPTFLPHPFSLFHTIPALGVQIY